MTKTRSASRVGLKRSIHEKTASETRENDLAVSHEVEKDGDQKGHDGEARSLKTKTKRKTISKPRMKKGLSEGKKALIEKEFSGDKGNKTKRKVGRLQKGNNELNSKVEEEDDGGNAQDVKATTTHDAEEKVLLHGTVKYEDGQPKKVGAHVSISGGLHKSVENAVVLGARAFGLFLRNQRQWAAKPLKEEEAERFKQTLQKAGFSPNDVLPHGIYLMNCASPDEESLSRSRETLVDELKRCKGLGLTLYNFHPGSTCGKISVEEGIERIATSINKAHDETKYVVTLIENMCCQGHTIGGKFEELKAIIDRVKDKARIGVCFDTCHAFAAGYDITSKEALDHTMDKFDKVVGLEYLKAVHLNDSKGNCGCNLDRHENIGHGKIGVNGFKALMNDARFDKIPMILETPECDYSREIEKLYSFVTTKHRKSDE